tara:strand:+ start:24 stop:755 length:732 start_codon:yes stop_codon:yes gene_type:complete
MVNLNLQEIIDDYDENIDYVKELITSKYKEKADSLFIKACVNNRIDIMKWINNIIEIKKETINRSFNISCQRNHLNIGKWLYTLGVDLDYDYFSYFTFICHKNYYEYAKWICSTINKTQRKHHLFEAGYKCNLEIFKLICSYNEYNIDDFKKIEINIYNSSPLVRCGDPNILIKYMIDKGLKPNIYSPLYPYYVERKKKEFYASVYLSLFVIKIQRSFKEYLYNGYNGILLSNIKNHYEKLKK